MTYPLIQNYTYDPLNRLDDASETSNGTQTWRQDFSYDRYGNRNFVEANTSFAGFDKLCNSNTELCATLRKQLNPGINNANNNRMNSGQDYTYDAAGNTLTDANGQIFVYDGENKQTKASTSSGTVGEYFYDGDGKRVKKYVPGTGETTIFVYDAAGKQIAEYSTVVADTSTAKVAYLTADHLGSPRINTDVTGAVTSRHDYHPFGEEIATSQRTSGLGYADDTIRKQFTGYESDAETDLDFAQARMYSPKLGRFMNADEPFNDQFEDNPQSWNLYIYVRNNPLNLTDPLGMAAGCPDGSPAGCYERDGKYYIKVDGEEREYDPTPIEDNGPPIEVPSPAPKCSANNPCRGELPDSWHDWVPAWSSFRQMVWNMKCQGSGGCNVDNALYYFGKTALELTPVGWAMRGAKAVQAAPSILQSLCFEEGTLILTEDGLKPIEK